MGHSVIGAAELVGRVPATVVIHKAELPFVHRITGLSDSDVTAVEGGDELTIGNLKVKLLHTPGHTPGSQCFLVGQRGRVGRHALHRLVRPRRPARARSPEDMYRSLHDVLATLPDDTVLFPGHNYADRPTSTIGDEKRTNMMLRFRNLKDFLARHEPAPVLTGGARHPEIRTMKDLYQLGETPPLGEVPRHMLAQVIRQDRFGEPKQAFRSEEIDTPSELAPDEVLVWVMAAGVNYNNVWAALGVAGRRHQGARARQGLARPVAVPHRRQRRLGRRVEGRQRRHHRRRSATTS